MSAVNAHPSHWQLPVSRSAIWHGAKSAQTQADLSFVDPMLRRRLSPLARAVFHVGHQCRGNLKNLPIIYASRHGELDRTLQLLQAIAAGEDLSPTTFGLSVLNANPGLYSIACADTAPGTAVAAGAETLGFGTIEAASRVASHGQPVLFIYADAPPPSPLGSYTSDPAAIIAIALLLDPAAKPQLRCTCTPHSGDANPDSQADAFLPLFDGKTSSTWSSGTKLWEWELS